jgi:fructoselysine-6-P-deglycase FrlB-like protein
MGAFNTSGQYQVVVAIRYPSGEQYMAGTYTLVSEFFKQFNNFTLDPGTDPAQAALVTASLANDTVTFHVRDFLFNGALRQVDVVYTLVSGFVLGVAQ